jgi:DNA repair exonuclease SbcCD ATPase subunit
MAIAQENEADIAKAATEAVSRIGDAREEVKLAEAARDAALREEADAKRSHAKVESETTLLRDEMAGLRTEKSSIAAGVQALRQERETLENEIKQQRSEGERLEVDRRQLERDQRIHTEATARLDRSRQLVEDLFADKVAIRTDRDALRIDPGPAAGQHSPVSIAKTDIEPWFDDLLQKHGNLVAALGRVEEVEDDLKKTRVDLRMRFPERSAQLRDEQEAEKRKISERLLPQPPGVDESGM